MSTNMMQATAETTLTAAGAVAGGAILLGFVFLLAHTVARLILARNQ